MSEMANFLHVILGLGFSIHGINCLSFPPMVDNVTLKKVSNITMIRGEFDVLDSVGLIEQYGYSAQMHTITTPDGYIINIFRITSSPKKPDFIGRPVVYIHHGMLSSSDYYLLDTDSLPFMLADAGYEVWLGNSRGNCYGRAHVKLSPDRDEDFWKFSHDEIGLLDVRTIIDYILEITGKKSLIYVGHSQGATSIYVLLSTRPDYNSKIKLFVSLAPAVFLNDREFPAILSILVRNRKTTQIILDGFGINEIAPQSSWNVLFAGKLCVEGSIFQFLCFTAIFETFQKTWKQLVPNEKFPKLLKYFPAGTSVQCLDHYAQNIREGTFRAYDYGNAKQNIKKYGERKAPFYNFSNIAAPNIIFYSNGDIICSKKGVQKLAKLLPNVVSLNLIAEDDFGHIDYVFARDIRKLVNEPIINAISQYFDHKKNNFRN